MNSLLNKSLLNAYLERKNNLNSVIKATSPMLECLMYVSQLDVLKKTWHHF